MSDINFSINGHKSGNCVYCLQRTENISKIFKSWTCGKECEDGVIEAYMNMIEEKIKEIEEIAKDED